MFMLEPAVATVSICLPAISALVTRGCKHVSTSYIRSSWSKRPSLSRSTDQSGTKHFSLSRKSFPRLASRQDAANSKRQQLLPIARSNSFDGKFEINQSANGHTNKSEAMSNAVDGPSSAFSPAKVLDEGLLSRSLDVERRIRQYYQRSEFPHGTHDTPYLENARPMSRKTPLSVTPNAPTDSRDPA